MTHGTKRLGFTLVELLVVIAIIGILIALLLPAVQAAREAARRSECSNNLKQIALALHNYHDTYKVFPPGGYSDMPRMPWQVYVLPFMEQTPLYEQFDFNQSYHVAVNRQAASNEIAAYFCPSNPDRTESLSGATQETYNNERLPTTHYYGIMGPKGVNPYQSTANRTVNYPVWTGMPGHGDFATGGILYRNSETQFASVQDGTSNTLLIGEISWEEANHYRTWHRAMAWGNSANPASAPAKNIIYGINVQRYTSGNFNDVSFGSNHPGGAQFGLADGSVTFISETIDMDVYRAAASRKGKEPAQLQ